MGALNGCAPFSCQGVREGEGLGLDTSDIILNNGDFEELIVRMKLVISNSIRLLVHTNHY